ncbi:unnamed protein product [Chrysoparadoxa australica]
MDMMVHVTAQLKTLLGYPGGNGAPGTSPWEKLIDGVPWVRYGSFSSEEPLTDSAVSTMTVLQANWASIPKIKGMLNATSSGLSAVFSSQDGAPEAALLHRAELYAALGAPHVIKLVETFASEKALLEFSHKRHTDFMASIAPFRAAVAPARYGFVPVHETLRPKLSTQLLCGASMPTVVLAGGEGKEQEEEVMAALQAFKLGYRHVLLQSHADDTQLKGLMQGVREAIEGQIVRRSDLFVTAVVDSCHVAASAAALRKGTGLKYFDALIVPVPVPAVSDNTASASHELLHTSWEAAQLEADAGRASALGVSDASTEVLESLAAKSGHKVELVLDQYHACQQNLPLLRFCCTKGVQLLSTDPTGVKHLSSSLGQEEKDTSSASASFNGPLHLGTVLAISTMLEHSKPPIPVVLTKWLLEQRIATVFPYHSVEDLKAGLNLGSFYMPVQWLTMVSEEGGVTLEDFSSATGINLKPGMSGDSLTFMEGLVDEEDEVYNN